MNGEVYRNKIYVSSPTSISIGHNTWFALDTKLVGRIKKLINDCEEKDKEIERLNNIIDELEKYLEQEIIVFQDEYDEFTKAQVQEDKIILEKLKELKEGDNDE